MKWNTELYNQQHGFVYQYGSDVVDLLDAKSYEKILDLGCGTGELTEKIKQKGALATGIDNSPEMIEKARKNFPLIPFEVKDAAALEYENEFDAVFSNAALHWIREYRQTAGGIYRALKPGGRLVAEFGGKGNVKSISDAVGRTLAKRGLSSEAFWYFPSTASYATLLEENGFRVASIQHIDRPTELKGEDGMENWIRMFGNNFFSGIPADTQEEMIREAVTDLRAGNYRDGKWWGDYKRLRVHAVKED